MILLLGATMYKKALQRKLRAFFYCMNQFRKQTPPTERSQRFHPGIMEVGITSYLSKRISTPDPIARIAITVPRPLKLSFKSGIKPVRIRYTASKRTPILFLIFTILYPLTNFSFLIYLTQIPQIDLFFKTTSSI